MKTGDQKVDNVQRLSPGIDVGSHPSREASILVTMDGQSDNIREGRWLEVTYKQDPNGNRKFNLDLHEDGVSSNGDVIDSVGVGEDQRPRDVREKVFRKAKELI